MKPDERKIRTVLCLLGILPVIWLGLLTAPAVSGGLPEIIATFPTAINQPFRIVWCGDSLKTVLIFLCCYGMGIGMYSPAEETTAAVRIIARQNGAMPHPSERSTGLLSMQITRFSLRNRVLDVYSRRCSLCRAGLHHLPRYDRRAVYLGLAQIRAAGTPADTV